MKLFVPRLLKTLAVSFCAGAFLWTFLFRTVRLESGGLGFVALSSLDVGDQAVFRYPFVTSPYMQAKLIQKKGRIFTFQVDGEKFEVMEELVLGKLVF